MTATKAERPIRTRQPLTPMLKSEDVANILQTTTQVLADWRYRGVGPSYSKPMGRVLYHPEDVQEFLNASRHESVQASMEAHGR